MKKVVALLLSLTFICLTLSACASYDKDEEGYVQFLAEFNAGLFATTNNPASDLRYTPDNARLQRSFSYGSYGLSFAADYQSDRIVYTVTNPTDDRAAEWKTFDAIYMLYKKSWVGFAKHAKIGGVSNIEAEDGQTLSLLLSGNDFTLTLRPLDDVPTIEYRVIPIA